MTVALPLAALLALLNAPPPPERLAEIHQTLLEGRLDDAEALAEKLASDDPSSRDAWELLAACSAVNGKPVPDRVKQGLARTAPPSAAPAVGQLLFVGAGSLRMRTRPDAAADIVGELPVNTPVQLQSLKGDWVEVHASVPPVPTLHLGAAQAQAQAPSPIELTGFVQTRFLVSKPPTWTGLVADASAMQAAGNTVEAARLLDRAAALFPGVREVRMAQGKAALEARDYPTALRALLPLRRGHGDGDGADDRLANVFPPPLAVFGCRGNRSIATTVEATADPKKIDRKAPHACLVGVDPVGPCPDPDPYAGSPLTAEDACDDDVRGSISVAECRRQVAATLAAHERKLAAFQKTSERFRARLAELSALFPVPSAVRFLVQGDTPAPSRDVRVFAFAIAYVGSGDMEATVYRREITISTDSLPVPAPGTVQAIWVETPGPRGAVIGLAKARNAREARQIIETSWGEHDETDIEDPGRRAPWPHVVQPAPMCSWGGKAAFEAP